MDNKDASKPPSKELREQKLALLREAGWHHWADLYAASIAQAFPPDYATI